MVRLAPEAAAAGFTLEHRAEIGSTNEAALAAIRAGADRLWIVADEQKAGRGRHGRLWDSPRGNLYASLGLAAPCPPDKAPLIGFVAGLSLAEAVIALIPTLRGRLHLKWPNDCLVDGAKVSGILLEGANLAGGGIGVVLGVGVNIASHPEGLDRPVTALTRYDQTLDRDGFFAAFSARFAVNLGLFDAGGGFNLIRAGWLMHALPLGTKLVVRPPSGEISGTFAGMDREGHLVIDTPNGQETVLAGDVFAAGTGLSPEAAIRTFG